MIYITKNTTNKVVLTLSENSSLTNPYYLFVFTNEYNDNPNSIYFTAPDASLATNRYNLFNIIENASGSTSGGTNVTLNLIPGQYNYYVYESTGSTLSVAATTGIVIESGRMIVDGPSSTDDDVDPTQNNTHSVYL